MRVILIAFLILQSVLLRAYQDSTFVLNAHSMIYHEAEGRIYIFGGATESAVINNMRVFDNGSIRTINTVDNPIPRTFSSMAYDPVDQSILLFGGSRVLFGNGPDSENLLNDTWRFHDGDWTKLSPRNAPQPRAEAAIAYDVKRERLVLFGGYKIEGERYVKLNDTWEFYDGNWYLAAETGPSARNGASICYDPRLRKTLLFGGSTADKAYGPATGETWAWDGKWAKLKSNQPANVFNTNMAYDPYQRRLIRFGGWNGSDRIDETWEFDSNVWGPLDNQDPMPVARNHSQLVYDWKNRQFVLFGGHNGELVFGDLWSLANGQWDQLINTNPLKRLVNNH